MYQIPIVVPQAGGLVLCRPAHEAQLWERSRRQPRCRKERHRLPTCLGLAEMLLLRRRPLSVKNKISCSKTEKLHILRVQSRCQVRRRCQVRLLLRRQERPRLPTRLQERSRRHQPPRRQERPRLPTCLQLSESAQLQPGMLGLQLRRCRLSVNW